MNYKKILKSRSLRLKVLKLFDFLPDSVMLKIQYYIKFGRKLNLKNPIYHLTTCFGHFGKNNLPWEKLDKVDVIKNLIKNSFKKSLETYDKGAHVQKNMAIKLINLLPHNDFEKVLIYITLSRVSIL